MRYGDITLEAVTEYGVCVVEGLSGTVRWYPDLPAQVAGLPAAWMTHSLGRTWIAHNDQGTSFRGTKAQVANWCLDQAANGTT